MSGRSFVLDAVNCYCIDSSFDTLHQVVIENFNANVITPVNKLARQRHKVEEWREELEFKEGKSGYIEWIHKLPFVKFKTARNDNVLSLLERNEHAITAIKNTMKLSTDLVGTRREWRDATGLLFDLWFKVNARNDHMTSTVSISGSSIGFTVVDFARPKKFFKKQLPDDVESEPLSPPLPLLARTHPTRLTLLSLAASFQLIDYCMNAVEDGNIGSFENFAKYEYTLKFAKLKGDHVEEDHLVEIKYDSKGKAYTEKIIPLFDIEKDSRLRWTGGEAKERHGVKLQKARPRHELARGHQFLSKYTDKQGHEVKKRLDEIINGPNNLQERAPVPSGSAHAPPPAKEPLPPHLESINKIPDGTIMVTLVPGIRNLLALTIAVFGSVVREAYEFKRYTGGESKAEPQSVPAVTSRYYRIGKEELAGFDKEAKKETDAVRNKSVTFKLLNLVQTGSSFPSPLSVSLLRRK